MKKTISYIVASLMVVSMAFAIDSGQCFTQTQIDNFNLNNIDADFLNYARTNFYINNGRLIWQYQLLDFSIDDITGEYCTFYSSNAFQVQTSTIWQCIDDYGLAQCRDYYIEAKNNHIDRSINTIRDRVADYQDQRSDEDLLDLFN